MRSTGCADFMDESSALLQSFRDCENVGEQANLRERLRVLGLREVRDLMREVSEVGQRLDEFLLRTSTEIQRLAEEIGTIESSAPESEPRETVAPDRAAEVNARSVLSAGVVEVPEADVPVHVRDSFSREFYETESARAPSRSEPQMICPHCGTTGEIRTRRIGRRRRRQRPRTLRQLLGKGGLLDLIRYYRESEEVLLATCLHCTASWQM